MNSTALIQSSSTLADLAVRFAGASRVFHRHGLDYCCNGRIPLHEACLRRELDPNVLLAELREAAGAASTGPGPVDGPLPQLIQHLLDHYHEPHRAEVPRLVEMATRVEAVHGDKPECPRGLAAHLSHMGQELEMHMQKEEQVLFPMILRGLGANAGMPISVMEEEHQDHGRNLERLRKLAHDFDPPECACNTWRALYLGLDELEQQLMDHIHLENNVLFPRALER
ncbi:MAG: iron-sulfur cluster repair protein YtfE [Planctomycetes bacterium]|nr:iron-sulfur cluster repair protein YtfE [Planctomycetota bacterium]